MPSKTKKKPRLHKGRVEHYKKLLVAKQTEIMANFSKSKAESRAPGDDGTEDYIDYAVNSYAKEFLLSLTDLERQQIVLIQESLQRIRKGEYGFCLQCNEEIAAKRLDAAPWARHCVRCQELEERGLLPPFGAGPREEDYEEDGVEPVADDRDDYVADDEE